MRAVAALCAIAALAAARPAAAQSSATGALERFRPAVPVDALFGVPSPAIGGSLVPRGVVLMDYAHKPLSIQEGNERKAIVSDQLFLHLGASLSLFDRFLVSADMPFALAQGGDSPTIGNVALRSPGDAQAGDLRLGARFRIFGDFWDPFQLGVGGYIDVPTAPSDSYAGDGSVRGEPHVLVGGRFEHFVYSASLGATIHAAARPHTFDARAGAAYVFGESLLNLQVGPELTIAAPFSDDALVDNADITIKSASPVAAELLIGAKVRVLKWFVIGAAAGPGLSQGWGTPVFFALGSIGYDPQPARPEAAEIDKDKDKDKILDPDDACPEVAGVRNDDPKKNGCPAELDADADKILDADDACPKVAGVPSDDPKKNGCPAELDADADKILDADDACPKVAGVASDDPKKNGCPAEVDSDADKILDPEDACPKDPGERNDDPKKNGCPDSDGDGVVDPQDACPKEKGSPDEDPKKNGCPHVTVTKTEILISRQVQFKFAQASMDQTVDPVSDDLLTEVRDAILNHPEIKLIEVQGHADDQGPESYNEQLSSARAIAVKAWLIRRGIKADKLISKGYGSKKPITKDESDKGRQENRRVQFVIVKKDGP